MLMKPSKRTHKAQSAMEYLMTYGWAILIIAVVLGALFSLGVFSSSNLLGTACIASSGYLCSNPSYGHGTLGTTGWPAGNIIVTVGQNTGTQWATANFVFVPDGTPLTSSGVPNTVFTGSPANTVYNSIGLISGQQVTISLPVSNLNAASTVSVGTPATGSIWAYYTTSAGVGQYAQIATLNIKAS
jgi:hypothetical protein